MTLTSAVILLFVVMGPLGNIPVFLSVLKDLDQKRRRIVIIRELLIALLILVLFLFLGRHILGIFEISDPSLSIAGGIILFLIALKLVFSAPEKIFAYQPKGEPFVVPLAVPSVAGPSAMATVMLLVSREPGGWLKWLIALLLAWLAMVSILVLSTSLNNFFGEKGLTALQRLMGLLLTAIAVQMFLSGIEQFVLGF